MTPMPKALPFEGVYFSQKANGRYRVQFRRRGRKDTKQITLQARTEALAYAEAVELGRRFEAGLFDPWKDRLEEITLNEAVRRYLASNPRISPLTRRERTIVLEAFARSFPSGRTPQAITTAQVKGYCMAPHLKASTQKGYFSKVRGLFNWLIREGYLRDNPCEGIREPKARKKLPVYLSRAEAVQLIGQAEERSSRGEGPSWLPDVVRMAVATGLRLRELCALRWCDVEAGRIYVRSHTAQDGTVRRTKSGHDRAIPLLPMAAEVAARRRALRGNENETETIFLGVRGGALYPNYVSGQFRKLRESAELSKDIHFHTLRHTFASWLVSDGVSMKRVQTWMGHGSIRVTEIYAHLVEDREDLIAAASMAVLEPGASHAAFSVPAERAPKNSGHPWTPVDSEPISDSGPGHKKTPQVSILGRFRGAEHGTRTRDLNLGKVDGDASEGLKP